MNADLTDGRCRVVGTRQLLKKLASDEISVLYVAKDAQRGKSRKNLTALAEGQPGGDRDGRNHGKLWRYVRIAVSSRRGPPSGGRISANDFYVVSESAIGLRRFG